MDEDETVIGLLLRHVTTIIDSETITTTVVTIIIVATTETEIVVAENVTIEIAILVMTDDTMREIAEI